MPDVQQKSAKVKHSDLKAVANTVPTVARPPELPEVDRKLLDQVIDGILRFTEVFVGHTFYTYQWVFAHRVTEAFLLAEGDIITALWSRQCLHEDTVILDRDGSACRIKDHPRAWKTGHRKVFKVTAFNGFEIEGTDDHPVLTKRGWVNIGDLRNDDWLCVLSQWDTQSHSTLTPALAKILGYLSADGYAFRALAMGQSVKFVNITQAYLDEFEVLIAQEFPDVKTTRYPKGKGFDVVVTAKEGHTFRTNSLRQFLLCMNADAGFPTEIFKADRQTIIAFLNRLFAADGCASRNIELSCGNSEVYAHYVQLLLAKLGIFSSIHSERMRDNKTGELFYRVQMNRKEDIRDFLKIVGPIFGKERQCNILNTRYARGSNCVAEYAPDGEDGEQRTWVRIRSIKKKCTADVYDIEYPHKGWFIAQGISVHNCGKTQAISDIAISIAVIVPALAKQLPHIPWLARFKDGVRIGIFAPIQEQSQLSYDRMRTIIESERGLEILSDPEIGVSIISSRGNMLTLSNGSLVRARSASPDSKIEGDTYNLILIDEAQEVDRFKVEKSIEPMRAAGNGLLIKIGTAFMSRGGFHSDIEYNTEVFKRGGRRNHFEFPYKVVIKEKREAYNRDKNLFHLAYEQYVEGQKRRYGEHSLSFRMNFKLEWQESNLDAIPARALLDCQDISWPLNIPRNDNSGWSRVAGIDLGRTNDSTVVTVMEVDLDHPIQVVDPVSKDVMEFYPKRIVAILELQGQFEDSMEVQGQYSAMVVFLREWQVSNVTMDATGNQDTQYERMSVLCPEIEFEPFSYTPSNKSNLFKHYLDEFIAGRVKIYSGDHVEGDLKVTAKDMPEWNQFMSQHKALEKQVSGQLIRCQAPQPSSTAKRIEGTLEYHDDYPNSAALAAWCAKSDMLGGVVSTGGGSGAASSSRYSTRNAANARYGSGGRYHGRRR